MTTFLLQHAPHSLDGEPQLLDAVAQSEIVGLRRVDIFGAAGVWVDILACVLVVKLSLAQLRSSLRRHYDSAHKRESRLAHFMKLCDFRLKCVRYFGCIRCVIKVRSVWSILVGCDGECAPKSSHKALGCGQHGDTETDHSQALIFQRQSPLSMLYPQGNGNRNENCEHAADCLDPSWEVRSRSRYIFRDLMRHWRVNKRPCKESAKPKCNSTDDYCVAINAVTLALLTRHSGALPALEAINNRLPLRAKANTFVSLVDPAFWPVFRILACPHDRLVVCKFADQYHDEDSKRNEAGIEQKAKGTCQFSLQQPCEPLIEAQHGQEHEDDARPDTRIEDPPLPRNGSVHCFCVEGCKACTRNDNSKCPVSAQLQQTLQPVIARLCLIAKLARIHLKMLHCVAGTGRIGCHARTFSR